MDAILNDLSYDAPDFEIKDAFVLITKDYVREKTKKLYMNRDFRKGLM